MAAFVQIQNFLDDAFHGDLLDSVVVRESSFCPATVTGDASYRRARVLYDVSWFEPMFARNLRPLLPWVLQRLNCPAAAILEMQLTAHGDGGYFRKHNDNSTPDCASRVLSYVYYFNREPRLFSGGLLHLYDIDNAFQPVFPDDNSIVFFPSDILHEVTPVQCPPNFADSRFTINGWVRT